MPLLPKCGYSLSFVISEYEKRWRIKKRFLAQLQMLSVSSDSHRLHTELCTLKSSQFHKNEKIIIKWNKKYKYKRYIFLVKMRQSVTVQPVFQNKKQKIKKWWNVLHKLLHQILKRLKYYTSLQNYTFIFIIFFSLQFIRFHDKWILEL